MTREIKPEEKVVYNSVVNHPLQSWEWGEVRRETGVKVIRLGEFYGKQLKNAYQLTIHLIPLTNFTIGYLPKGPLPTSGMIKILKKVGQQNNCVFIQLEPNIVRNTKYEIRNTKHLFPATRPLFTKYTFHIDLTKSEEELLKNMHPKTRYNIKVAQRHGVTVQEENTPQAFEKYLQLTASTTKRQGFYAHSEKYHRLMWKYLNLQPTTHPSAQFMVSKVEPLRASNQPIAHLLTARYQGEIIVTWILFLFKNILYYPYGASSTEYKQVMASNLMMWEAIKWGKQHGAKLFDLWGTPGPDPVPTDAYYGFHKFKLGYSPKLIEFIGSYDLVLKPLHYRIFRLADKLRWIFLKINAKFKA